MLLFRFGNEIGRGNWIWIWILILILDSVCVCCSVSITLCVTVRLVGMISISTRRTEKYIGLHMLCSVFKMVLSSVSIHELIIK